MRLSDTIPATKHHLKMFLDKTKRGEDLLGVQMDSCGRQKRA